jgi:hypothetical protein
MKKYRNIAALFAFCTIAFFACRKAEVYPIEPSIKFKYVEHFGDTINPNMSENQYAIDYLAFDLIDGDGDVGYDDSLPEHNNITVILQEKINGKFSTFQTSTYKSREIPIASLDKTLKAEIQIEIFYLTKIESHDTIRYIFSIKDRSGHQSNADTTPPIPFKSKYIKLKKQNSEPF